MGQRRRKSRRKKILRFFSTPGEVKIMQGILSSPGVGKAKAPWGWVGSGVGGPLFRKFHPPLTESVPQVGNLHPVTACSVIVVIVGSGAQLPHTDVATHPRCSPPTAVTSPGGGGATPRVLGRQVPPPSQGASGQQLVVKGMSPRSQRAPKAPNGVM